MSRAPRRIAVLPGDGVGAEVVAGPTELLEAIAAAGRIELTGPWPVGASAFGELGTGLPESTLAACDDCDAMFFGAAGEHPGVSLDDYRPEHSIIGLRQRYDLRVSIRNIVRVDPEAERVDERDQPRRARPWPERPVSAANKSGNNTASNDGAAARPLIVLRNLLGGAYGAAATRTESDGSEAACDEVILTPAQITELAEMACDLVEQGQASSIVSADKANLLATSRLWRSITTRVAEARGVPLRHTYVDRMAFELAHDDVVADTVVLTEGIFGDMLSDLAAGRAGSIALCGSASVNPGPPAQGRCVGLFEPVHGSAPRHAGLGRVNPSGAYLALAALLEWFTETAELGPVVTGALSEALEAGPLTYDLAPAGTDPASTEAFAAAVNARALPRLKELL
ncbi:MAG: isocitrate/isopropylmalate family dehydrogenase [Acidimicrobiaceae bacterium]|nr:isocitrate/isopropylmalate family dehydrogenase [Acidimicrobiaceae bacterium]